MSVVRLFEPGNSLHCASERIRTYNPELEAWKYMQKFENPFYVRSFLEDRIAHNFHGLKIDDLNTKKQAYNDKNPNLKDKVEIFNALKKDDINDELVSMITNNVKQGLDFYKAAKQLPILSQPILLHYSFEKLAHALVLSTYSIAGEVTNAHGIVYDKTVNVRLRGLFPRFHDCYSTDPSVYLEHHAFILDDLIKAYSVEFSDLMNMARSTSFFVPFESIVEQGSKKEIKIAEADRELLSIFAFSVMARYRVNKWNNILQGWDSDMVISIRSFMESMQAAFPIMILAMLLGQLMIFAP